MYLFGCAADAAAVALSRYCSAGTVFYVNFLQKKERRDFLLADAKLIFMLQTEWVVGTLVRNYFFMVRRC